MFLHINETALKLRTVPYLINLKRRHLQCSYLRAGGVDETPGRTERHPNAIFVNNFRTVPTTKLICGGLKRVASLPRRGSARKCQGFDLITDFRTDGCRKLTFGMSLGNSGSTLSLDRPESFKGSV